jgi:hypothetical protein
MTLRLPRLLALRALVALLLATIALQATPAHAFGPERHSGSPFDAATRDVAAMPAQTGGELREIALPQPEPTPPPPGQVSLPAVGAIALPFLAPQYRERARAPPVAWPITSLELAPRAPPAP